MGKKHLNIEEEKQINVIDLYSGIGMQKFAIERVFRYVNLLYYCDNHPPVSRMFSILHNCSEKKNVGDLNYASIEKSKNFFYYIKLLQNEMVQFQYFLEDGGYKEETGRTQWGKI